MGKKKKKQNQAAARSAASASQPAKLPTLQQAISGNGTPTGAESKLKPPADREEKKETEAEKQSRQAAESAQLREKIIAERARRAKLAEEAKDSSVGADGDAKSRASSLSLDSESQLPPPLITAPKPVSRRRGKDDSLKINISEMKGPSSAAPLSPSMQLPKDKEDEEEKKESPATESVLTSRRTQKKQAEIKQETAQPPSDSYIDNFIKVNPFITPLQSIKNVAQWIYKRCTEVKEGETPSKSRVFAGVVLGGLGGIVSTSVSILFLPAILPMNVPSIIGYFSDDAEPEKDSKSTSSRFKKASQPAPKIQNPITAAINNIPFDVKNSIIITIVASLAMVAFCYFGGMVWLLGYLVQIPYVGNALATVWGLIGGLLGGIIPDAPSWLTSFTDWTQWFISKIINLDLSGSITNSLGYGVVYTIVYGVVYVINDVLIIFGVACVAASLTALSLILNVVLARNVAPLTQYLLQKTRTLYDNLTRENFNKVWNAIKNGLSTIASLLTAAGRKFHSLSPTAKIGFVGLIVCAVIAGVAQSPAVFGGSVVVLGIVCAISYSIESYLRPASSSTPPSTPPGDPSSGTESDKPSHTLVHTLQARKRAASLTDIHSLQGADHVAIAARLAAANPAGKVEEKKDKAEEPKVVASSDKEKAKAESPTSSKGAGSGSKFVLLPQPAAGKTPPPAEAVPAKKPA